MTYTETNLHTTQYDLLRPTYAPPSMTYWDCSMTYCNQPRTTQYDLLRPTYAPPSMTY